MGKALLTPSRRDTTAVLYVIAVIVAIGEKTISPGIRTLIDIDYATQRRNEVKYKNAGKIISRKKKRYMRTKEGGFYAVNVRNQFTHSYAQMIAWREQTCRLRTCDLLF